MPERVQIYIDGGNFHYLALKPLGIFEVSFDKKIQFDFDAFADFIADQRDIAQLGKRYYIGTVRTIPGDDRRNQARARQVKLFMELAKTDWQIKTSKLRNRTERVVIDNRVVDHERIKQLGINEVIYNTVREKGIDVKIATDMIAGAVDDKYDTAIIVSSDTDLVPAIDWIRKRCNKRVEYIGFSMKPRNEGDESVRPTQALIRHSDGQRILVESDIRKFQFPEQTNL